MRSSRANSTLRARDAAVSLAVSGLPAAVGARAGRFDPVTGVYVPANASNVLLQSKAVMANAFAARQQVNILCLGDSETAGVGTNAGGQYTPLTSYPGRLAQILGQAGYPKVGTGWVYPCHNLSVTQDSRITSTGSWGALNQSATQLWLNSTGSGTLTFTSDVAGTVAEFQYLPTSTAFTYQIDGATAVNVTPAGSGQTPVVISVTGLASTTHTITINATGTGVLIQAFQVRTTAGGVLVSNAGLSGSTALQWTQSPGTPGSVGNVVTPNPDLVLMSLGINDARTGGSTADGTVAQFKANYIPVITRFSTSIAKPVWLCVQVPPATADQATSHYNWGQFQSAIYDLADTYGLPVLDLTYLFGGYQNQAFANTNGLYFDSLHPSDKGYAVVAGAWFNALVR